jgi:hypothetical protein
MTSSLQFAYPWVLALLAIVPLMRPPKGVLSHDLELLELGTHTPPLVVRERVPVLWEERGGHE